MTKNYIEIDVLCDVICVQIELSGRNAVVDALNELIDSRQTLTLRAKNGRSVKFEISNEHFVIRISDKLDISIVIPLDKIIDLRDAIIEHMYEHIHYPLDHSMEQVGAEFNCQSMTVKDVVFETIRFNEKGEKEVAGEL